MYSVPGPPVCSRRWSTSSLTSLTINWEPPKHPNGNITGYFLQLLSFDNATVLLSGNVSNTLSYTFTGLNIGMVKLNHKLKCHVRIAKFPHTVAGVPYHVRVYAENTNGRGSYCITTDFGDQLSKNFIHIYSYKNGEPSTPK